MASRYPWCSSKLQSTSMKSMYADRGSSQGSRLVLQIRVTHARNTSGPSSFGEPQFTIPSHLYSAVNLDEEFPRLHESDESSSSADDFDFDSDREDAALNPSRSNSGSRHTRALSDVESQSPPSPLSPETRHRV